MTGNTMKSQWECVLENLGAWEGSFTRLSPQGEIEADIPSLITLTGVDDNRSIHLSLVRHYPDAEGKPQAQEMAFDFNAPGAGAIFFETGAFSEGSVMLRSGVPGGAEFAFRHGDRRLRLIQQFDGDGKLYRQTLVRGKRQGTTATEFPPLDVETWTGLWQGEAVTLYPGSTKIDRGVSSQNIELIDPETVTISQNVAGNTMKATFRRSRDLLWRVPRDDRAHLWMREREARPAYQMLLLPDRAYSYCPTQVSAGEPIVMAVGWLISPQTRQRIIRRYNDRGEWLSLTFITEEKQN